MRYEIDKNIVTVTDVAKNQEIFTFRSEEEAVARVAICEEAISWIGTPYRNCADIKGKTGGVDCAMLLVRCYVDTGRLLPFDPRPYPPQWHMHNSEERFLNFIEQNLNGKRIEKPSLADVTVYKFGRCYAHGSIYMGLGNVIHSAAKAYFCLMTRTNDIDLLCYRNGDIRDNRFYEVTK